MGGFLVGDYYIKSKDNGKSIVPKRTPFGIDKEVFLFIRASFLHPTENCSKKSLTTYTTHSWID